MEPAMSRGLLERCRAAYAAGMAAAGRGWRPEENPHDEWEPAVAWAKGYRLGRGQSADQAMAAQEAQLERRVGSLA